MATFPVVDLIKGVAPAYRVANPVAAVSYLCLVHVVVGCAQVYALV